MAGRRGSLSQRLCAFEMTHAGASYETLVADRKRRLFEGLAGTVVEIGPGTGPNFRYFPPSIRWIGFEPNPFMEPHLRREAERAGFSIDLRNRAAEQLDLADACADAVVSTLVLCSVLDVAAALAEIRRVLRPGGRFIFLEHVAAPPGSLLRALQRAARPFSRWTGGNCYPDRETGTAIEAAGFGMLDLESFRLSRFVYGPTIMGTAVR